MSDLTLKDLYFKFRNPKTIKAFANEIKKEAISLKKELRIMEICGGHTHTIMKYGLKQLLPENISFIHGPGCPVCIMPKERIDHAIVLAKQKDVILVTLGDMIRVPGSNGSLAKARSEGANVIPIHSTMEVLKIAQENLDKKVVFFAIGFETTTPMTPAVIKTSIKMGLKNLYFHINHVVVPPPVKAIMDSGEAKINAFIGPSNVSVITGTKVYQFLVNDYDTPVVVAGFEPVDVMEAIFMLVKQKVSGKLKVENQYKRATNDDGNLVAQNLINEYFEPTNFRWRGLGDIPNSALKLKKKYSYLDAEVEFKDILPNEKIDDHKMCICGDILKGLATPKDCKVFAKGCDPTNPLGSCMVSDEGACNAYYRYDR